MARARRKKKGGGGFSFDGGMDFDFGGFSLEDALNDIRNGPIPFIAGVTDGDQNARLEYMMWQMKSPQQKFADSALGDLIGASPLGDPSGEHGYARWGDRNDYWGGLARNIVSGSPIPRASLSNVAGVEGDLTPRLGAMVDDVRYKTGMTIEEILDMLRRGQ